jgi:hypothetical protein
MTKFETMKQLTWKSREIKVSLIDPTPENYKIKTEQGRERLKQSLKQFGLAGTVVVNYHPTKKGRFILIDGNSRRDEAIEKKEKTLNASVPSRPLTSKEFKLMSAMFDFAKAGEVDVERIRKELGKTSDFFAEWGMNVPMEMIDKIGKKGIVVAPKVKAKTVGAAEVGDSNVFMRNLFFNKKQADAFDKQMEKLQKKFKTTNVTDTVFKAVMKCK